MRRHVLGILSLILLAVSIAGWSTYGLDESEAKGFAFSSCLRIGLVFGASWLAFPQVVQMASRVSVPFAVLMSVIGMIIVIRPRTAIVFLPVMAGLAALQFMGWLMKPPERKTQRKPQRGEGREERGERKEREEKRARK
jgi:hypothetical protein